MLREAGWVWGPCAPQGLKLGGKDPRDLGAPKQEGELCLPGPASWGPPPASVRGPLLLPPRDPLLPQSGGHPPPASILGPFLLLPRDTLLPHRDTPLASIWGHPSSCLVSGTCPPASTWGPSSCLNPGTPPSCLSPGDPSSSFGPGTPPSASIRGPPLLHQPGDPSSCLGLGTPVLAPSGPSRPGPHAAFPPRRASPQRTAVFFTRL